jgi:hypothetical protein
LAKCPSIFHPFEWMDWADTKNNIRMYVTCQY